jgi:hypothetical protein
MRIRLNTLRFSRSTDAVGDGDRELYEMRNRDYPHPSWAFTPASSLSQLSTAAHATP